MTYVSKNCEACGDLISVRLADHKRGWGRFCDKACAAAYKTGQRPGDVNQYHANCMGGFGWAADRLEHFAKTYPDGKPPRAPKIKAQVGKVKVTPVYHSPCNCWKCGQRSNGPGLCDDCCDLRDAMDATEYGWDGHKS
jgi:hypothetical protein